MLKQLFIGEMRVPIPVPLKTLEQVIRWVGQTLMEKNSILTSIELDGRSIELNEQGFPSTDLEVILNDNSQLKLTVDSPVTLALEALDAVRELAAALQSSTPKVAVTLWQHRQEKAPTEFLQLQQDQELMVQLLGHIHMLMDTSHINLAPTCALVGLINRMIADFKKYQVRKEWKECAKTLVDRQEYWLRNLIEAIENLHIQLMAENPVQVSPRMDTSEAQGVEI